MKPKYKVGDHVIQLDGPKKGKKAIITEVDDNPNLFIKNNDELDYVYYIDPYIKGQRRLYCYSTSLELDKEYYRDKKINDILVSKMRFVKFRTYVDKMRSLGRIENHKCHMISSDVWATKSDVNDKNVCIGSINFNDKKI